MAEKEVRLIDANALEKALEEIKIPVAVAKGKMFNLIKEAPTIDPESLWPQWISVKKHLPPLNTPVIVAVECGNVFAARRTKNLGKQFWTNAVWDYKPMEGLTGKVTHWMPMPEPPAKED